MIYHEINHINNANSDNNVNMKCEASNMVAAFCDHVMAWVSVAGTEFMMLP